MGESETPPRDQPQTRSGRLASERVIINAPMSFAGSAQRAWRMTQRSNVAARIGLILFALLLIPFWWILIAGWYVVFGLFLVPYRLLRRGARKRKAEALRHRELLGAIEAQKRDTQQ